MNTYVDLSETLMVAMAAILTTSIAECFVLIDFSRFLVLCLSY